MLKDAKESKREGQECMRPCFPFKPGMLAGQGPSTLNDDLISAADSLRAERAVLPPRTFLIASQMLIKLFRTRFRVASKQTLLQSDVQMFRGLKINYRVPQKSQRLLPLSGHHPCPYC